MAFVQYHRCLCAARTFLVSFTHRGRNSRLVIITYYFAYDYVISVNSIAVITSCRTVRVCVCVWGGIAYTYQPCTPSLSEYTVISLNLIYFYMIVPPALNGWTMFGASRVTRTLAFDETDS